MAYRREDAAGSLVVIAIAVFVPVLLLLALRMGMLLQRKAVRSRFQARRDMAYRLTEPIGPPGRPPLAR